MIRTLAKSLYPLEVRTAKLVITFVNDDKVELPVFMGKVELPAVADPNAKDRIMAAMTDTFATPKQIFKRANVSSSHHSRKLLWELVDDGKVENFKRGFRKR